MCGLIERLSSGVRCSSPSSVQFYELRLLFLITALRPELRAQLQQVRNLSRVLCASSSLNMLKPQGGGVSLLTGALESCLEVRWKEPYECELDPAAPPISLEASQRVMEVLKVLFNITHSSHRLEPSEVCVSGDVAPVCPTL